MKANRFKKVILFSTTVKIIPLRHWNMTKFSWLFIK